LYFQSKDEVLPLIVELRPMLLGVPTSEIYPFSQVVVDPEKINISDDGSVATHVEFSGPVYLKGGTEHALVLRSDSNEYYAWISQLGEVDATTLNLPEDQRIVVSSQPDISKIGVLFKSQNASTWSPSQFEDLKFTLYTAVFETEGSVSFYNPILNENNNHVSTLRTNAIESKSRKIRIGLTTNLTDSNVNIGNTILQTNSDARGNLVAKTGHATGTLTITNPGIGYTPSDGTGVTYNNVSLLSLTGSGKNATADITIGRGASGDGVAVGATIVNGGYGYEVGEVLYAEEISGTLGRGALFSVAGISSINALVLDNVQGTFKTGVGNTLSYQVDVGGVGIPTSMNGDFGNIYIVSDGIDVIDDGLHLKINHSNHGMHSPTNQISLKNVFTDRPASIITEDYPTTSVSNIQIEDTTEFTSFEGVGVGTTNPGYVLVGNEIIKYTGVSGSYLTGIERNIDGSASTNYVSNLARVYKYEVEGISLRRINKTHLLQNSTVSNSIGLDHYNIKIDMSSNGTDRSGNSDFSALYLQNTRNIGGDQIEASENIQYETIEPNIGLVAVTGTSVDASIRTISATSISGNEVSFIDQGYENVALNKVNYLNTPRIICSEINEDNLLTAMPYNKSFEMIMNLRTTNDRVSPVIDLDRVGINLTSNRVNSEITNYITDNRISTIKDDPSAFIYATKPISLEFPASSLRIYVAAYVNNYSDLRAFYAVMSDPNDEPIYYPFPGYANKLSSGEIIDISQSDGSSDKKVQKNSLFSEGDSNDYFIDYEFSADNIGSFKYFSIKLVATSVSQVFAPRLRDLRVISLA
jgi:hypothetical protein